MGYPARTHNGELQVKVGNRWRAGTEHECAWCFSPFYVPTTQLLQNKTANNMYGSYCTRSCQGKAHAKEVKRQRIIKLCVIDKQPFSVPPSKAKRFSTCSPECREEYRRRRTIAMHERRKVSEI